MATLEWVIDKMNAWAPEATAEDFDNVGLLLGDRSQSVKKILVALDATDAVIKEAIDNNYDAIITHHPLTYQPLKKITACDSIGRKLLALAKNGISLYAAHTNLDKAHGGVNDVLAKILAIENVTPMAVDKTDPTIGIGRIGGLSREMTLAELAEHIKERLALKEIRYSGDLSTKIKKIALCGGSGMSFWQAARDAGCHVYITGDVKYSDALQVLDTGMAIIDITHYSGENIIVNEIVKVLSGYAIDEGTDVTFTATGINGQIFFNL